MNLANARGNWAELIETVQKVRAERDPRLPDKLIEKILSVEVMFIGAAASNEAGKDRLERETLNRLKRIVEEFVENGNA